MNNEYETIRKTLLSLLCAGDKICYIYRDISAHDVRYRVMRCTVNGIIGDKKITIITIHGTKPRLTSMIEAYEGRLFIHEFGQPTDRDKRIAKMISIINAKETVHEYDRWI
jgi:hypothetical protein